MKKILLLNPENASLKEVKKYPLYKSARAVVFDDKGKVALLNVTKSGYYKLPGGGIEKGEDKIAAVKRECKEEIGADIEIIKELGSITEYRKMFKIRQTSYCYLARLKGKKGNPNFTEEEVDSGFKAVWVSYNEALKLISRNITKIPEGKLYIVLRDTAFLKEAGKHLDKKSNFSRIEI